MISRGSNNLILLTILAATAWMGQYLFQNEIYWGHLPSLQLFHHNTFSLVEQTFDENIQKQYFTLFETNQPCAFLLIFNLTLAMYFFEVCFLVHWWR